MIRTWLRRAAPVLAFWTAETVYSAAHLHYRASLTRPMSWWMCFQAELIWTSIGLALTPGVLWLARRFPIDRGRLWRNGALHLAGAVLFAAIIKIYWDVIGAPKRPEYLSEFTWERFFHSMSMGLDAGLAIYWGIVLAVLAADYYRRYQAGLVEAAQLQTQLVQAQLRALRMQLDPHFLFNALHGISELVHQDPEAAESMIARLSELLRRSIDHSGAQEVTLREEIDFLNLYLEIEKTRFESRLRVHYRVTEEAELALVPSLVLQPLVENAIRHGISKRLAGGSITISARREGERLILSVADDGAGLAHGAPAREGVGLSSTRGRLERLYGAGQSMDLVQLPQGVEARIVLPYHHEAAPVLSKPVEIHAPPVELAREAHAGD